MTRQTPIERAAQSLPAALATTDQLEHLARAVLESIDTNQLAAVILRTELPGGIKVGHADKIALAVKNWLTEADDE